MRFASGFRYTDPTNGFKGMSRGFLLNSREQPFPPIFQYYADIKIVVIDWGVGVEAPGSERR